MSFGELYRESIHPYSNDDPISLVIGDLLNMATRATIKNLKSKQPETKTETEVKTESNTESKTESITEPKTESKNDSNDCTKKDQREKSEDLVKLITDTVKTVCTNVNQDNVVVNEPKKITTKTGPMETNPKGYFVDPIKMQNILHADSRPIITIPVGTQLCPDARYDIANGEYYITLNQRITLHLDNTIAVVINGSTFYVVDCNSKFVVMGDNSDHKTSFDQKNLQSFIVPKGTIYFVNDSNKDPIGLPRTLEADTRFRIRPGSQVHLDAGTTVIFSKNTITEKDLSSQVRMVLSHEITCTI